MSFHDERAHQPNETAARLRQDVQKARARGDNADASALIDCAGCDNCAFRNGAECRAWPPRPRMVDGAAVATWPQVKLTDWCGCWRAL